MKKEEKMKERLYIYAYDPKINRRVVHVVKDGMAISLITKSKFRYSNPPKV
ncbi:MAG: hypothetical protein V1914_02505 [archaeon]